MLMTKDTDPTGMYLVDMQVLGIIVYLEIKKKSVYMKIIPIHKYNEKQCEDGLGKARNKA